MDQITHQVWPKVAGSVTTTYAVSVAYANTKDGGVRVTSRCYMFTVEGNNPLEKDAIIQRARMFNAEWWREEEYGPLEDWRVVSTAWVYMVQEM